MLGALPLHADDVGGEEAVGVDDQRGLQIARCASAKAAPVSVQNAVAVACPGAPVLIGKPGTASTVPLVLRDDNKAETADAVTHTNMIPRVGEASDHGKGTDDPKGAAARPSGPGRPRSGTAPRRTVESR